jgi:tRNA A-37 threonylcarbamoyl transferase component Bud32
MKRLRRDGISWFLDGGDDLVRVIAGVTEKGDARRGYSFRESGNARVFLKYFLEQGISGFVRNRIMPRGKKEYDLATHILAGSVAVPRPLGYGVGARGSFVIQERIEGRTLKAAFEAGGPRGPLLDGLALLLARLASEGIRHNDLHLDNIIQGDDGTLYLIDLHKTVLRKHRAGMKDELSNLTQALAMIHREMTGEEMARFFEVYGRPDMRSAVEAGLRAERAKWIESKMKRAFSTTSKLSREGRRVRVRGTEGKGDGPLLKVLKKDRKVLVCRYGDHIKKTYRARRRLARAWKVVAALEYMALPIVPRPFFVELPSLFGRGYIAMEDLGPFGEEMDRFLDRHYDAMGASARRAFAGAFAQFLAGLLRQGIIQRDMKACNVFVLEGGFRLLDVEDITFLSPGEEDVRRMLAQLNCSLPVRIAMRDRIRFFLRLARPFPFNKKRLFRKVAEACRGQEVVYEGASGLIRESWEGRPSGPLSP